jgi:hypothetical protein
MMSGASPGQAPGRLVADVLAQGPAVASPRIAPPWKGSMMSLVGIVGVQVQGTDQKRPGKLMPARPDAAPPRCRSPG